MLPPRLFSTKASLFLPSPVTPQRSVAAPLTDASLLSAASNSEDDNSEKRNPPAAPSLRSSRLPSSSACARWLGRPRSTAAAPSTAAPSSSDSRVPYGLRPPSVMGWGRASKGVGEGKAMQGGSEGGGAFSLVATLYAHGEGVRLLATNPGGRVVYSAGRSTVQAPRTPPIPYNR